MEIVLLFYFFDIANSFYSKRIFWNDAEYIKASNVHQRGRMSTCLNVF